MGVPRMDGVQIGQAGRIAMHPSYYSYPRYVRDYEKWETLLLLFGTMSVMGALGGGISFIAWMLYHNDLATQLLAGYGIGCAVGLVVFAFFRLAFLYGKGGARLIERLNEIGHDHSNPGGITPDHTQLKWRTLRWAPGISLVYGVWWVSMQHWLLAAIVFGALGFSVGYWCIGNPVVLTVICGVLGVAASYKKRHPPAPPFAKKMAPH